MLSQEGLLRPQDRLLLYVMRLRTQRRRGPISDREDVISIEAILRSRQGNANANCGNQRPAYTPCADRSRQPKFQEDTKITSPSKKCFLLARIQSFNMLPPRVPGLATFLLIIPYTKSTWLQTQHDNANMGLVQKYQFSLYSQWMGVLFYVFWY